MTAAERILASRLMELAAGTYSNHSCNDVDLKMFEGLSDQEKAELLVSFQDWDDPNCEREREGIQFVQDHEWMSYLADKMKEGA